MTRRLVSILAAGAACLASAGVQADIFGVVVGIDDYAVQSDLEGAVNDAKDIAGALEGRGADVILLKNEQATRSAVVGALQAQFSKARDGDVVVFTYAGHGIQMDESLVGDELDGMDEAFVFAGFEHKGENAAERLRDNDVAMLMKSAPEGVSVLFVADSCHSGTMTRAPILDANLGKTRFLDSPPIENDPLPPPDRDSFQLELDDMPHVVFAAASRDNQETPEIDIDGVKRGALSWSIARTIENGLPSAKPGETLPEFREYIRAQVRAHSGARQTPDVVYAETGLGRVSGVVALLSGEGNQNAAGQSEPSDENSAWLSPLEQGEKPTLAIRGQIATDMTALIEEARLVEDANDAILTWDVENGHLIDRMSADLIAEIGDVSGVADAVRKWRAVQGLASWAPHRAFRLEIAEGDDRHLLGSTINIRATMSESGFSDGHLILVNLASGGEVQFLFPSETAAQDGSDLISRRDGPKWIGEFAVSKPFGADHLLGIVTTEPADVLRQELFSLTNQRSPQAVLDLLSEHAGNPATAKVAVLPIHTARQ